MEKLTSPLTSYQTQIINMRLIVDLYVKGEIIKLLEET